MLLMGDQLTIDILAQNYHRAQLQVCCNDELKVITYEPFLFLFSMTKIHAVTITSGFLSRIRILHIMHKYHLFEIFHVR